MPTPSKSSDAICEAARQVDLVQAYYGRDAIGLADRSQEIEDACRGGRVEACYRLVGKDQPRLLSHSPRDADTLLLPARKLVNSG